MRKYLPSCRQADVCLQDDNLIKVGATSWLCIHCYFCNVVLVCITEDTPINTIEREDGWKGFRIQGVLNFSLIGILSEISGILADNNIGIFSVSTFNTDYILVKEENFDRALKVLAFAGYNIV